MSFFKKILGLFWLLNVPTGIDAQISHGGVPPSYAYKLPEHELAMLEIPAPDREKLNAEDLLKASKGGLFRYGIGLPVQVDVRDAGTCLSLADGGSLWRLEIFSPKAEALGLFFDAFELVPGSELFIYSPDYRKILGSFNELNNPANNLFSTELIAGSSIILEYYEPPKPLFHSRLNIRELVYAYRSTGFLKGPSTQEYNSSASCEVDVNCPEGTSWQDEKRGVARISIKDHSGNYGWCSGSLVNNTRQDCLPYFLTAYHCADAGITDQDLGAWVFYFNYERVGCNVTAESEPTPLTVNGAYFRAQQVNNTSSDFILLALSSYLPASMNSYFNGWKNTNASSTSGVGIHHPAGDIKKISTYTTSLSNYYNTHWAVVWATTATGHGVTEGGSSGSPLFNANGEIVGTLTGGLSACTTNGAGPGTGPNKSDVYGKFSYSWASGGNTPADRLKDWLDPDATGVATLAGKNNDCATYLPLTDFSASSITIPAGSVIYFTNKTIFHPGYGTTYLWEFQGVDGALTTVVKNPNRKFSTPGIFPVKLTGTNTFGSTSKTIQITVSPNGMESPTGTGFSLFPNPSDGEIMIETEASLIKPATLSIFSMTGALVGEFPVDPGQNRLMVKQVPAGIYEARLQSEGQIFTRKLVIQRAQ